MLALLGHLASEVAERRSTSGLISLIISSIERISALCGVAPTLNEKQI
jgi:hypothetical protein